MQSRICRSATETQATLMSQNFDVIFVDYLNKETASNIVAAVRGSKLNRQTIMMTLTCEDAALKAAYNLGVLLTMPRPKSPEHATRCLEPFYQLILRQRQKALRVDTSIPVQLRVKSGNRVSGKVTNLSASGAALMVSRDMSKGDIVSFDFPLPEQNTLIHAIGRVAWAGDGRAGLGFALMLDPEQMALQQWVSYRAVANRGNSTGRIPRARSPWDTGSL